MTSGANMLQLKDKGVGVIAAMMYSNAIDSAENRKFMKLFHDKFPNRELSSDVVEGYSGAQVLESALKTVSGQIEDKQSFLSALYKTDIETARGRLRLDADHDAVENVYVYQITKEGNTFGQKILDTYTDVSRAWDRTPQELDRFPFGTLKGKWVGMTKAQLDELVK